MVTVSISIYKKNRSINLRICEFYFDPALKFYFYCCACAGRVPLRDRVSGKKFAPVSSSALKWSPISIFCAQTAPVVRICGFLVQLFLTKKENIKLSWNEIQFIGLSMKLFRREVKKRALIMFFLYKSKQWAWIFIFNRAKKTRKVYFSILIS